MTYNEAKEISYNRSGGRCEGCGDNTPFLTPSHRLPQSRYPELKSDPENIDILCFDCHDAVEIGAFDKLKNGLSIARYIKGIDPAYYWGKIYSRMEALARMMTKKEIEIELQSKATNEEAQHWKILLQQKLQI